MRYFQQQHPTWKQILRILQKLGLIKVKDWIHYNLITPTIETVDLTLAELKQLQIQAFKEFYLRPKWIAKQLVREGRKFLNVLKQILRVLIKSKLKGIIGFHPRLQTLVKNINFIDNTCGSKLYCNHNWLHKKQRISINYPTNQIRR